MFFGKKNALLCVVTGLVSAFMRGSTPPPSSPPPMPSASLAMNHFGKWRVVQSNDPLVERLPPPRVVTIEPGRFEVAGRAAKAIFGGFRVEPAHAYRDAPGVVVSMAMWNVGLFRKLYTIVPLDPYRMCLSEYRRGQDPSPTGKGVYYLLERYTEGDELRDRLQRIAA